MVWQKKGLIFKAEGQQPWMQSHTAFPTPIELEDRIRIYFASRCHEIKSRLGYVDVAKENPNQVIGYTEKPILDIGKPGTFDDCGVNPDCALHHDGKIYLYYHGWTKCGTVPHRTVLGLAISHDGGNSFEKISDGPLFERGIDEPYFCTNPYVMKDKDCWRMWYMSVTGWHIISDKYEATTVIRYAESDNGIDWQRKQIDCIKPNYPMECHANASVIYESNRYKMWYCYRSAENFRGGNGSYRMGYAESTDAMHWERYDSDVGIDVSASGWDCEMLAYPTVLDVNQQRLMFYNGNGFGQSGMGYAIFN